VYTGQSPGRATVAAHSTVAAAAVTATGDDVALIVGIVRGLGVIYVLGLSD